ncbi:MAG: thioredoxin domain-containing protein [Candidatus Pacebacteria bacterium]|nr:thioredoxin domain-containing protein [Candidatus Paceibacterota bacterium]
MKSPYTIPFAIIAGGIIVAGAVYVSMPKIATGGNPALVRPVDSTDHILGNPTAKVTIIEYADFDCDYCKGFNETLHQIVANEGVAGQVAWIYREFPLVEIHQNALAHARAAECVAQVAGNDMFWKFETALFNAQPVEPANYGVLAKSIGVSGDAFASCYAGAATSGINERIVKDRQNALDMGAQGTPYSVILVAGKSPIVMAGGYSYDAVKQLVDGMLDK